MTKCNTCKVNNAVIDDYREIGNVTTKFRSCDDCRFLGMESWLELKQSRNKMMKRCVLCVNFNDYWCARYETYCHLITSCTEGDISIPEWFLKQHLVFN